MNAEAWSQLAEHSRATVHQASLLMGVLTDPGPPADAQLRLATAARAAAETHALLAALSIAPELAAHQRTVARFEAALAAWRRSVDESSPLERRYQTALLQQAAQALTSCLHVEALAVGECARIEAAPFDAVSRRSPPPSMG